MHRCKDICRCSKSGVEAIQQDKCRVCGGEEQVRGCRHEGRERERRKERDGEKEDRLGVKGGKERGRCCCSLPKVTVAMAVCKNRHWLLDDDWYNH